MNVSARAEKALVKLAKTGRHSKDSVRVEIISGCCSETVIFVAEEKRNEDKAVYSLKVNVYAGPDDFSRMSGAEVDFDLGGFIVRSETLQAFCQV